MASIDPDYDLAIGTYSAIWPRYERAGLDGLTGPERAVFLAWEFVCEVNNGGFSQFFSNPSGAHAVETPAALSVVNMPIAASLLMRALEADSPPRSARRQALENLTGEFFDSPENPYELIAQYVRGHSEELPAPLAKPKPIE